MLKVITPAPSAPPAKIYISNDSTRIFIAVTDELFLVNIADGQLLNLTDPCAPLAFLTAIATTENMVVVSVSYEFVRYIDIAEGETFIHRGIHYLRSAIGPIRIDTGNRINHRDSSYPNNDCQRTELVITCSEQHAKHPTLDYEKSWLESCAKSIEEASATLKKLMNNRRNS